MLDLNFLQTEEDYVNCLTILDDLKEYGFTAMNYRKILPTTYTRLEAAVNYLYLEVERKSLNSNQTKFGLSQESLKQIKEVATVVSDEKKDIKIKERLNVYVEFLIKYLEAVYRRTKHEVLDNDIEMILSAIYQANEIIDNK